MKMSLERFQTLSETYELENTWRMIHVCGGLIFPDGHAGRREKLIG